MAPLLTFSEEQIARLFGHEAAEDESPERLRQYYFRSEAYNQVTADLQMRILVGHKGIGKSALFQVALNEDRESGVFAVDIRPNEIQSVGITNQDFLGRIEDWKTGLRNAILEASLRGLNITRQSDTAKALYSGGSLVLFLAEAIKPLANQYLNTSKIKAKGLQQLVSDKKITVYIDDLDRGWTGSRDDIYRLSSMFSAVRDLARENPGLRFRISLRSDVYYLVRTSDQDTDKIQGSVVWYTWTNHQILALLAKRVETFFGRDADERLLTDMSPPELARYLSPVVEERFQGEGKWANAPMYRVIMSMIRRRPRDLVKLMTLASRRAASSRGSLILTSHFKSIFEEYSQDRIQDTVNEYKSEVPSVERLIFGMKPNRKERDARTGFLYTTDELLKKIGSIQQGGAITDAFHRELRPKQIAQFLYKINFLIASKELESGYIDRKYFEENRYLSSELVDFGYSWEVHPAYRWALQPDDARNIYSRLALSE